MPLSSYSGAATYCFQLAADASLGTDAVHGGAWDPYQLYGVPRQATDNQYGAWQRLLQRVRPALRSWECVQPPPDVHAPPAPS